jgi:hypothetical protein
LGWVEGGWLRNESTAESLVSFHQPF